MRRLHVAIGTTDIEASVQDYSARFGCAPEVVIPNQYALWRTDTLNFSIRKVPGEEAGSLRHLGWEDPSCEAFSTETDVNCIVWESFSKEQQAAEIGAAWPGAASDPDHTAV